MAIGGNSLEGLAFGAWFGGASARQSFEEGEKSRWLNAAATNFSASKGGQDTVPETHCWVTGPGTCCLSSRSICFLWAQAMAILDRGSCVLGEASDTTNQARLEVARFSHGCSMLLSL